jgi:hypothetical protein
LIVSPLEFGKLNSLILVPTRLNLSFKLISL